MYALLRAWAIVLFVVAATGCQPSLQVTVSHAQGRTLSPSAAPPTIAVSVSRLVQPESISSPTPAPSGPPWSTEYGI